MNNKKMDSQVVCAEKSARRIEGAMQAHMQESGAGARINAPRSFGTVGTPDRIENSLKTFPQTGRSMIEMLGVLAIIGVLTIGGLMGYRYAMNKHKANTILNDVSLAMADLTVLDPDGGAITRRAVAFRPDSGLAMEFERTADGNNIVYVSGVAKAVCQILIQIQPTDAYEHIYDGDLNALTTCADTQAMAFGSKETAEGPDTPECQNDSDCGANQVCQDGRCVDKPAPSDPCENVECFNDGTCNDGSCDCVNGYTGTSCEIAPQCNDSKPCSSPKQCENYICVCPMIGSLNECQEVQKINGCDQLVNKTNATCGTNGFCSNGACSECTLPKVVNTAKDGCECPTIEHCGMYDDACKCASCDLTCSEPCEELDSATCSCVTKLNCTPCSNDADCTSGNYCDELVCTPCISAQSRYVCCSVLSIDGDNPSDHVWVGGKFGDGYCCTSKNESEKCCTADSGKWCDGVCCKETQLCGNAGQCCEAIDPSTCANGTTTDANGCTICSEVCSSNERDYDGKCCPTLDCEIWETTQFWGCSSVCMKDVSCQDYLDECEYMCRKGLHDDCIPGSCVMTEGTGYNDTNCYGGTGHSCSVDYQTYEGEENGHPLTGSHFAGSSCS